MERRRSNKQSQRGDTKKDTNDDPRNIQTMRDGGDKISIVDLNYKNDVL